MTALASLPGGVSAVCCWEWKGAVQKMDVSTIQGRTRTKAQHCGGTPVVSFCGGRAADTCCAEGRSDWDGAQRDQGVGETPISPTRLMLPQLLGGGGGSRGRRTRGVEGRRFIAAAHVAFFPQGLGKRAKKGNWGGRVETKGTQTQVDTPSDDDSFLTDTSNGSERRENPQAGGRRKWRQPVERQKPC